MCTLLIALWVPLWIPAVGSPPRRCQSSQSEVMILWRVLLTTGCLLLFLTLLENARCTHKCRNSIWSCGLVSSDIYENSLHIDPAGSKIQLLYIWLGKPRVSNLLLNLFGLFAVDSYTFLCGVFYVSFDSYPHISSSDTLIEVIFKKNKKKNT